MQHPIAKRINLDPYWPIFECPACGVKGPISFLRVTSCAKFPKAVKRTDEKVDRPGPIRLAYRAVCGFLGVVFGRKE